MKRTLIFPALRYAVAAVIIATGMMSCHTAKITTAKAFFEKSGPKAEVFTFNTSTPKQITLNGGTVINVPADAFTIGGAPANGIATLKARTFAQKGEMALGGLNTTSNGNLLESQGSFEITVLVNGRQVDQDLAPGKFFQFNVPVPPGAGNRPTQLFRGEVANAGLANGQFNWAPAFKRGGDQQPGEIPPVNGGYPFNWNKLGWINCDIFYNITSPKTTLTVDLPGNPGTIAGFRGGDGGETFVLFVPFGYNTAAQLYTHTTNTQVASYPDMMPIDMEGVLLAYCIKNGNAWFAKKTIKIVANMVESLTLQPSTTDAIQAELNSLNGL